MLEYKTFSQNHDDERDLLDDGGAFKIFKLDRRREARQTVVGNAMAAFSTGHDPVRLVPVDLLDGSAHGVGVLSPVPVEMGTTLCLYPSTAADQPNLDARRIGLVVRCEPKPEGYVIGVRCAAAKAAA
jgi:hypothetical protein